MKKPRRSQAWYGGADKDGFIHRSWMKNQGFPDHVFDGRPIIRLSASKGELELLVDEAELAKRRAQWLPEPPHYVWGYAKLYIDHVMQAEHGADFDFLVGKDTRPVTRESH